MTITGTPVFDGIAVAEVRADLLQKTLSAKAAFINTQKGTTHGWTEGSGTIWSKETKLALAALVDCMERDLGALHLGLTGENAPQETRAQATSGLGEFLEGDTTKSI